MFNKILVTLDGSELAEKALPLAISLAQDYEAKLILLRVYEREQALAEPSTKLDTYHLVVTSEKAMKRAEKYLENQLNQIRATHPEIKMLTAEMQNKVSETILEIAKNEDIDLIVMTSHGYTGFRRLVLGSVSHETTCSSNRPVLIVPVSG